MLPAVAVVVVVGAVLVTLALCLAPKPIQKVPERLWSTPRRNHAVEDQLAALMVPPWLRRTLYRSKARAGGPKVSKNMVRKARRRFRRIHGLN